MIKKASGITLIALVVTIIVLLILAGVSISMIVGNNGILTQASNSVERTREASATEEVALAWSSVDSEYWGDWANNNNLAKSEYFTPTGLNKYLEGKGTVLSITTKDDSSIVAYKKDDTIYQVEIDAAGNGSIKKGITAEDYGKEVIISEESSSGYIGGWRIMYSDNTNIYLISSEVVDMPQTLEQSISSGDYSAGSQAIREDLNLTKANRKYPAAEKWLSAYLNTTYNSTEPNMQATMYLLDSANWNSYFSEEYAEYVIGAPTFEMVLTSINKERGTSYEPIVENQYGYSASINLNGATNISGLQNEIWGLDKYYWLACPSSALSAENNAYNVMIHHHPGANYFSGTGTCTIAKDYGARPVVCLKPGVELVLSEDGESYMIK